MQLSIYDLEHKETDDKLSEILQRLKAILNLGNSNIAGLLPGKRIVYMRVKAGRIYKILYPPPFYPFELKIKITNISEDIKRYQKIISYEVLESDYDMVDPGDKKTTTFRGLKEIWSRYLEKETGDEVEVKLEKDRGRLR